MWDAIEIAAAGQHLSKETDHTERAYTMSIDSVATAACDEEQGQGSQGAAPTPPAKEKRNRSPRRVRRNYLRDARERAAAMKAFRPFRSEKYTPAAVACSVLGLEDATPVRALANQGLTVHQCKSGAWVLTADLCRLLENITGLIEDREADEGAGVEAAGGKKARGRKEKVVTPRMDVAHWTREEVAAYLRCSVDTVDRNLDLVAFRKKIGGKVLYNRLDVMRYGDQGR